jgi:hypothetical protein
MYMNLCRSVGSILGYAWYEVHCICEVWVWKKLGALGVEFS